LLNFSISILVVILSTAVTLTEVEGPKVLAL